MGRYGKGMRDCCDSLAKEGVPHIHGCSHADKPIPDDIMQTAIEVCRDIEAMPTEGNFRIIARVIQAERDRGASIARKHDTGDMQREDMEARRIAKEIAG